MAHATHTQARNKALFSLLLVVMALASGCGDTFRSSIPGGLGGKLMSRIDQRMDREPVTLVIYTACEGLKSANPETRCSGVQDAGIEVFFEGNSLIFDFSNAPSNGTISNGSFEGFVLNTGDADSSWRLVDARVDEGDSTIDPTAVGIEIEEGRAAFDLRGLDYDDTMFVKVNLDFDAG